MDEPSPELPGECWALIISHLGHYRHHEPLSLVCKTFLTITNKLRVSLKVVHPSIQSLSLQLQRFPYLKMIDLSSFHGELDHAALQVARSGLHLEELILSHYVGFPASSSMKELAFTMNTLKILRLTRSYINDSNLAVIADWFPSMEELDISEPHFPGVTDEGIVALLSKVKGLRRINLAGNTKITNESLIRLSSTCEFLEEIVLSHFFKVTHIGISFMMKKCRNYKALILATNNFYPLVLKIPLDYPQQLHTIDFHQVKISDEFLYGMIEAHLPLKNLYLSHCSNFTFNGLSSLLKAYLSLQSLGLDGTDFLTDEYVKYLARFLRNLTSVKLKECLRLTALSFFTIASACPHLHSIEIGASIPGKEHYASGCLKNLAIKSLHLSSSNLTSIDLKKLFEVCPNVQQLTLIASAHCKELDMEDILGCCPRIRGLSLDIGDGVCLRFSGREDQVSKLQNFSAKWSGIDDKVLTMVAKTGPELIQLDLKGCRRVSERGLKEVVTNCNLLRDVNLDWCTNVNPEIIRWMVSTRPSLRKIVTPGPTDHTSQQLDDFLSQGCLVVGGSWDDDYF